MMKSTKIKIYAFKPHLFFEKRKEFFKRKKEEETLSCAAGLAETQNITNPNRKQQKAKKTNQKQTKKQANKQTNKKSKTANLKKQSTRNTHSHEQSKK